MYGFFWRLLPGPWPVRGLLALATCAAVIVALFGFGFPAVEPHLPWSHDTVSSSVSNPSGDYSTTWSPTGSAKASPSSGATGSRTPGKSTAPSVLPGD